MKTSFVLLSGLLTVSVGLSLFGCVNEYDDDFGTVTSVAPTATPTPDGPTPTPTAPSLATFTSDVEPFFAAGTCASSTSCHMGPAGHSDSAVPFNVDLTAADDYAETDCATRLTAYGATPTGNFLSKFCTGTTPANATTNNAAHNGSTATAAQCANWYTWAAQGAGPVPTCSPAS
jgi:hypothetical protein